MENTNLIHKKTGIPLFTDETIFQLNAMLEQARKDKKKDDILKAYEDIKNITQNKKLIDGMLALFTSMQACVWTLTNTDEKYVYSEEKDNELALKTFHPIVLCVIDQIIEHKVGQNDNAADLYKEIGDMFEGKELYVIVPALAMSIYSVFNMFDIRKEDGNDFMMYQ